VISILILILKDNLLHCKGQFRKEAREGMQKPEKEFCHVSCWTDAKLLNHIFHAYNSNSISSKRAKHDDMVSYLAYLV